jgi:hypothetical protein
MAVVDGIASSYPARDPEDRFSEFQHHIDDMLNKGYINPQIVAELNRLGFKTSIRSLKRYLSHVSLKGTIL